MKFFSSLVVALFLAVTSSFSASAESKGGFTAFLGGAPKGGVDREIVGYGTIIETPVPSVRATDVVMANLKPPYDTLDHLHRFRLYHCHMRPKRELVKLASWAYSYVGNYEGFETIQKSIAKTFHVPYGCVIRFSPASWYGTDRQAWLILGRQDVVIFAPRYVAEMHVEGLDIPLAMPYLAFLELYRDEAESFGLVQNPFVPEETFPVAFSRPVR